MTRHSTLRRLIPVLAAVLFLAGGARRAEAQESKARIEARITDLLQRMTLEEKVGEMTQLTLEAVSRQRGTAQSVTQLDSAKLENALLRRHVGSLLNVYDVALTPAQWRAVITTVQRVAARKRIPIPVLYGIDAVHGFDYMNGATVFPQSIAMAATWNPALVRREHEITAYETRAAGIPWNFSPVLDVGRQPLWSRFFETYGEDVYLASVLGREAVLGEQRDPRPTLDALFPGEPIPPTKTGGSVFVAATGKHYLGYSAPLSGYDRTTAYLPVRQLRELYLPPFQAAIRAGLRTVMVNSSDVNGIPVHANHEILTTLLRDELGFDGIVVSDWNDIERLHTVHHSASSVREAVRQSVMAGVDMAMSPLDFQFTDALLSLVREGRVPMSRIDEAVRRILRVKLELGLFDDAMPDTIRLARVGSAHFAAVSRTAAEEAITLLKNDRGILPLSATSRVLVTGPGATSLPAQFGSWSYTWQGTDTAVYPRNVPTLLDAIRTQAGASRVTYVPGASFTDDIDVAAAVAAAKSVDVVIVALAEYPSAEKPGDIDDLALPWPQINLAREIEATGTPVVIAIFQNRPRLIRLAVDSARAVVTGFQTGPFGGTAMAEVLFGAVNPSGRLPFSWPRYGGAIVPYDHAAPADVTPTGPDGGYNPEWPFGHGLSYTTFTYSKLHLDRDTVGVSGRVRVSVDVTNSGRRAGKEVVQLYVRELYASVDPPVRRLRGFEKIALAPGEHRTVTVVLPVQRLAFVGIHNRLVVDPGDFDVMIGPLSARLVVRRARRATDSSAGSRR